MEYTQQPPWATPENSPVPSSPSSTQGGYYPSESAAGTLTPPQINYGYDGGNPYASPVSVNSWQQGLRHPVSPDSSAAPSVQSAPEPDAAQQASAAAGGGGGGAPWSPQSGYTESTGYSDEEEYSEDDKQENIRHYKKEIDHLRERGASIRAMRLMEATVVGETASTAKPNHPHGSTNNKHSVVVCSGGLMKESSATTQTKKVSSRQIRQAAIERYEKKKAEEKALKKMEQLLPKTKAQELAEAERKRKEIELLEKERAEKSKAKAKKAELKAVTKLQQLVPQQAPEALATSTRKKKGPAPKDTLASMKCQMDIDRENAAKKKALFLLNFGKNMS
jgi:hypothetical protein